MTRRAEIITAIALILWAAFFSPFISRSLAATPDHSISGQVFTADGKPADSAFVTILLTDDAGNYRIVSSDQTSAAGEFLLTLPVPYLGSSLLLVADLPGVGFAPPVVVGSGQTSHLELTPPAELDAAFLDNKDKPIPGRPASPRRITWPLDSNGLVPVLNLPPEIAQRWQTKTGPDGVAIFHGLPRGADVDLDLDDDHYARRFAANSPTLLANGITHQTLHVATGVITGNVRDLNTSRGIPRVTVATERGASAVTDKDGNYTMQAPLGVQAVYLQSDPPGYIYSQLPRHTVNVDSGQPATMLFGLTPDPNMPVEGRVLDPQGNPVAGATILYNAAIPGQPISGSVGPITAISDAEGRFHLRARSGTQLRARYNDLATASAINVGAPGEIVTLQLSADATFTLTVKVVDSNGVPIPAGTAELIGSASTPFVARGVAIADGVLRFDGLASDSPWRVKATAPGYGQSILIVPPPSADSPHQVEITMMLDKADQPVSGIIVDQDGNPAPGIKLMLLGPQLSQSIAVTDTDGHFSFLIPKGVRGVVQLVLPAPYQAYAQISGACNDLKFYLPADMTPAAASQLDRQNTTGPESLLGILPAQRILAPPATQPTPQMMMEKLNARRAAEINAQRAAGVNGTAP